MPKPQTQSTKGRRAKTKPTQAARKTSAHQDDSRFEMLLHRIERSTAATERLATATEVQALFMALNSSPDPQTKPLLTEALRTRLLALV